MLKPFLIIVLLLSGFAGLAKGQGDPLARPRRTQTPATASGGIERVAPSPEALAESKRLYKAGVKYGKAGLFKQAVNNFEEALKFNPDYADAYFSLGHAYSDLGQWQQAVDTLRRGLALKPKDNEAQDRLAYARVMLERENADPAKSTNESGDSDHAHDSAPSSSLDRLSPDSSKPEANDIALTKVYRVGPGDVLEVRLPDDNSQSSVLTVTAAGMLEHPGLGASLPIVGLTVEEIAARIEDDLKQRSPATVPHVTVELQEYVSHTILVSGLVKEPGPKILKREAIPLYVVVADAQALPEAGQVNVLRNEPSKSYLINLSDSSEMSLLVRPGDVINLQANPAQFFYLGGNVKSPGEKTFRSGLTLMQAIIAAGGTLKNAKEARLARDNGKGFLVMERYKLRDIDAGKVPDPVVQPGDRITVE